MMLNDALLYATHGWPVLPVHTSEGSGCSCGRTNCSSAGKHPRVSEWAKAATIDRVLIRQWWTQWPGANIGIHVGRAGIVVIDIDPRHKGRIEALPLAAEDRLTPTAVTGGKGLHLIFRAPLTLRIVNSSRRLPDGIDVRAGEAYIVAPPSLHESGRHYSWQPGRAPWQIRLLPLPAALVPLLVINNLSSGEPGSQPLRSLALNRSAGHPYVEKALRQELDNLTRAAEGQRNNVLNETAFKLGQFIEAGLLPRERVELLLEHTALAIGLEEIETRRTIKSGIEAGVKCPRHWPNLS